MLELLGKLSIKLQPFRKLCHLLSAILISAIIFQLLQAPSQQQQFNNAYTMLGFIACIWLLLINLLISIFTNIPTAIASELGMISRFKMSIKRGFYRLLALLFIVLTLVIVFLSIRMLRV